MKKRGNRDQMGTLNATNCLSTPIYQQVMALIAHHLFSHVVISTKYTTNFKAGPNHPHIMANYVGNGTKSLHVSVNASLRKLQTDYIDLLYIHWWDYSASIPEVMQSLNQLVATGKILYLGISDAPAWIVRCVKHLLLISADQIWLTLLIARPMNMLETTGFASSRSTKVDGPRLAETWSAMSFRCARLKAWP